MVPAVRHREAPTRMELLVQLLQLWQPPVPRQRRSTRAAKVEVMSQPKHVKLRAAVAP